MNEDEFGGILREAVKEMVDACVDLDLLDLVYKLLMPAGPVPE